MKRIVVRGDDTLTGYLVELIEALPRERVVQKAYVHEVGLARKLAARWATMHGGCQVDDRTK